ncbi:MAG: DUF1849 family protein [Alphaproteobacteria bacterium]
MKRTAAIMAFLATMTIGVPAQSIEIATHRAIYRLSMLPSNIVEGGIADVQGGMTFEWADSCDGWTVEQRYVMNFLRTNGTELKTDTSYVTWESKDGLEYRFSVKRVTDGVEGERIGGRAKLEKKGGAGMAKFDQPKRDNIALSAGTVFPTEHTFLIIEAANAGKQFDRHLVFDGSSVEAAAPVTTFFLGRRPAPEDSILTAPLGPNSVQAMNLSFYEAEGAQSAGDSLPTFEMTLNLQDNGIVTDMILRFDGFRVAATLERIEKLPPPEC